jgi:nucleotide-binding universal stress UspA family protein
MSTRFNRILVPTDFSERSSMALEYGQALAERFGASLHVLHVVEDPFILGATSSEIYVPDVPALRAELVTEAEAQLANLLRDRAGDPVRVTTEVRVGHAAAVISGVAETTPCDLIVMGTHGRTGVAHMFLGSVAEKVVRTAPCPVLTIRGEAGARQHVLEPAPRTGAQEPAVVESGS